MRLSGQRLMAMALIIIAAVGVAAVATPVDVAQAKKQRRAARGQARFAVSLRRGRRSRTICRRAR